MRNAIAAAVIIYATAVSAAENPAVTMAPRAAETHPWYVKFASAQIVEDCCLGWGMMGGMGGGMGGGFGGGLSTIFFSSQFTQTLNENTATTLYTTIPGSTVTYYGPPGVATTSIVDVSTISTVITPAPEIAAPTAAPHGLVGLVEEIENYAHAVAEAIIAPQEMTALLSSAAEDILQHGFIHATKAEAYMSQASQALDALQTDPAYSAQSARLAHQPTHFNLEKAFAVATSGHSAGIARLMSDPQSHRLGSQIRGLADKFMSIFSI